ncbi:beta-Ala-His dipeptidase [Hespellia stercorisuis]|uniref:Cytosol non-specific dipeptidase n=1 Tax=Hespellia stercorisuis DSM 15480 TaxID=1121950 RepID=A0A1M6U5T1_9FIRM|nr:beta-Ala-His dipeptidase [Hespellia stercorisuis]SHK64519.1 dipeptidase D [Hespellia stercorisuis DSM 15480]
MSNVLNQELLYEKYFEEICQYPHGSYNEQVLSDHIVEFAKEKGLEYKQDDLGNVIIYKNGTKGLVNHPALIIQAHIDMICEKRSGVEHDFEKDPLKLYLEDGWIRANGTTLGGDDGAGVAYMMAVLADESLKHPPLECLFTVQEEVGCAGAAQLEASSFRADRLLSLDEMSGNATTVSGAGMNRIILTYDAKKESSNKQFYKVTIGGLLGGHSGDDIHKERGNANKLAGRLLFGLMKEESDLRLAAIEGGSVDNAISRTCTTVFASQRDIEQIRESIDGMTKEMQAELKYSDGGLWTEIKPCGSQKVFSLHDTENIVKLLFVCPDGFQHRSMHLELTTASSNIGVLKMENEKLIVSIYIRGASQSFVNNTANEIKTLAEILNWKSEICVSLPSWEYREDSPLRKKLQAAYEQVTGREMKEHAEHGCLEAGHFVVMKPEMDIATLGPLVRDYHTFDECMNRDSFKEIYEVFTILLENL